MMTEEALETIGLDKKEAKIYLATLELGESTVLPIANKSGLQRTYCYDILNSLAQKGLVSFVEKRGRRRYTATEPKMVKKLFDDKLKQFDEILPDLEGLYQKAPARPRVRFFEGKEAVEIIHQEIINEAKEVWFMGSVADWAKNFPNYVDFVKKQIKAKIRIRDLVRPDSSALKFAQLYKKPAQEMRFLPKHVKFATDNIIWNNKFVMISFGTDLFAVSIESAEIANTMREFFEILWAQAKPTSHKENK